MQRWCSKLRSLAPTLHSSPNSTTSITKRTLHISPNLRNKTSAHFAISPNFMPLRNAPQISHPLNFNLSPLPLSLLQVRHITAKQRKRKLKSRKPMTPSTSKVKKIKIKYYSSFKGRFRVMSDGQIRRWKEGKRHNAHLKSKKARRRLRRPGTVPLAYAKVMKKLNFAG